jgi:hypothetical protein
LRGKFFESFGPDRAGSPQFARRHWRGHGEMEARVKSGRLIRNSEIAIELLELTTQSSEVARHGRGIADVVVRAKVAIEGCFYLLVPERPLAEVVTERAKLVAERQSKAIEHSMRLEDQAVKDKRAARALREQVIEDLLKRPARLWDEE